MTDDEIIKMLKEIDMCTHTYDNGMHIITAYDITKMRRFAERIVASEREACAKVCEELPNTFKIAADEFGYTAKQPTAENYAAAIRTRDDT